MRILHLASSNRWTGAAAPAWAEVEALRGIGEEAHYAYVGGYKLEQKLSSSAFAHPIIAKRQDPFSFAASVKRIRRLMQQHSIDTLHAHLTYDHLLALACRTGGVRVFRTFHSRRTLRSDPFTRGLLRRTDGVAVINDTFADAALLRRRGAAFTPPPLDTNQFTPTGENARSLYGLGSEALVIGIIGKVAPKRGFEEGLSAFAAVRATEENARLLIIGHGPHRPFLETLSRKLQIEDAVVWAGYHEDDLADHYRAMDHFFFTAPGSDGGHRALLEAMGCGVPVTSGPIAGVDVLLGPLSGRFLARGENPEAFADRFRELNFGSRAAFRDGARQQALTFGYRAAAERLRTLYKSRSSSAD